MCMNEWCIEKMDEKKNELRWMDGSCRNDGKEIYIE